MMTDRATAPIITRIAEIGGPRFGWIVFCAVAGYNGNRRIGTYSDAGGFHPDSTHGQGLPHLFRPNRAKNDWISTREKLAELIREKRGLE